LAREEYLTEGTLTMFDGFQFTDENPYTYGEGKRLLKLATAAQAPAAIGADGPITAVTGRGASAVAR